MRAHPLALPLLALSLPAILAAPFATPLTAQETATLHMRVVDGRTGASLPGAVVRVEGMGTSGVTGPDGVARLRGIGPGTRTVRVALLGYGEQLAVVEFTPGAVVEGEAELVVQPVQLRSIQATAQREMARLQRNGYYERKRVGGGTFIERAQIDSMRITRVTDAVAGVRGTIPHNFGSSGFYFQQVRFGSRRCVVPIFVDGQITHPVDFSRLRADQVEAIEVYSLNEAPPQFNDPRNDGNRCGAIVIWTRD